MTKDTYSKVIAQIEGRLKKYAIALTESEEEGERLYQRTIKATLKELVEIPDSNVTVIGWTYKTLHDLFMTGGYKEEIRTEYLGIKERRGTKEGQEMTFNGVAMPRNRATIIEILMRLHDVQAKWLGTGDDWDEIDDIGMTWWAYRMAHRVNCKDEFERALYDGSKAFWGRVEACEVMKLEPLIELVKGRMEMVGCRGKYEVDEKKGLCRLIRCANEYLKEYYFFWGDNDKPLS